MTLLFQKSNFGGNFIIFLEVSKLPITLQILSSSRNACLATYFIPPANQKVVFVENDAGSYHGPYVFLRARMVDTGSACFV